MPNTRVGSGRLSAPSSSMALAPARSSIGAPSSAGWKTNKTVPGSCAHAGKHLRGTHQHGGVAVVPAGVCNREGTARIVVVDHGRRKIDTRIFLDGQRVPIGAKRGNPAPGLAAVQRPDHAMTIQAGSHLIESDVPQVLGNQGGGLDLTPRVPGWRGYAAATGSPGVRRPAQRRRFGPGCARSFIRPLFYWVPGVHAFARPGQVCCPASRLRGVKMNPNIVAAQCRTRATKRGDNKSMTHKSQLSFLM